MKVANSLEHNVGEMNPDQCYDAFFNPKTRRLIQVTSDGYEEALAILSSTSERKNLMLKHGVLTNPYKL